MEPFKNKSNSSLKKCWWDGSSPIQYEDLLQRSDNWTLGADAAIATLLQQTSKKFIDCAKEMETKLQAIETKGDILCNQIDSLKCSLLCLGDNQYVENRISEVEDLKQSKKEHEASSTNESCDEDYLSACTKSILVGVNIVRSTYESEQVANSDSDDEFLPPVKIYRKKDSYIHRPLPPIIGSDLFFNSGDDLGLSGHQFDGSNDMETSSRDEVYSLDSDAEMISNVRPIIGMSSRVEESDSDTDDNYSFKRAEKKSIDLRRSHKKQIPNDSNYSLHLDTSDQSYTSNKNQIDPFKDLVSLPREEEKPVVEDHNTPTYWSDIEKSSTLDKRKPVGATSIFGGASDDIPQYKQDYDNKNVYKDQNANKYSDIESLYKNEKSNKKFNESIEHNRIIPNERVDKSVKKHSNISKKKMSKKSSKNILSPTDDDPEPEFQQRPYSPPPLPNEQQITTDHKNKNIFDSDSEKSEDDLFIPGKRVQHILPDTLIGFEPPPLPESSKLTKTKVEKGKILFDYSSSSEDEFYPTHKKPSKSRSLPKKTENHSEAINSESNPEKDLNDEKAIGYSSKGQGSKSIMKQIANEVFKKYNLSGSGEDKSLENKSPIIKPKPKIKNTSINNPEQLSFIKVQPENSSNISNSTNANLNRNGKTSQAKTTIKQEIVKSKTPTDPKYSTKQSESLVSQSTDHSSAKTNLKSEVISNEQIQKQVKRTKPISIFSDDSDDDLFSFKDKAVTIDKSKPEGKGSLVKDEIGYDKAFEAKLSQNSSKNAIIEKAIKDNISSKQNMEDHSITNKSIINEHVIISAFPSTVKDKFVNKEQDNSSDISDEDDDIFSSTLKSEIFSGQQFSNATEENCLSKSEGLSDNCNVSRESFPKQITTKVCVDKDEFSPFVKEDDIKNLTNLDHSRVPNVKSMIANLSNTLTKEVGKTIVSDRKKPVGGVALFGEMNLPKGNKREKDLKINDEFSSAIFDYNDDITDDTSPKKNRSVIDSVKETFSKLADNTDGGCISKPSNDAANVLEDSGQNLPKTHKESKSKELDISKEKSISLSIKSDDDKEIKKAVNEDSVLNVKSNVSNIPQTLEKKHKETSSIKNKPVGGVPLFGGINLPKKMTKQEHTTRQSEQTENSKPYLENSEEKNFTTDKEKILAKPNISKKKPIGGIFIFPSTCNELLSSAESSPISSPVDQSKPLLFDKNKSMDSKSSESREDESLIHKPSFKKPAGGIALFGGSELLSKLKARKMRNSEESSDGGSVSNPVAENPKPDLERNESEELFIPSKSSKQNKTTSNPELFCVPALQKMPQVNRQERGFSFDEVVDNTSHILHCPAKNRAKIRHERRAPSIKKKKITKKLQVVDKPDSPSAQSNLPKSNADIKSDLTSIDNQSKCEQEYNITTSNSNLPDTNNISFAKEKEIVDVKPLLQDTPVHAELDFRNLKKDTKAVDSGKRHAMYIPDAKEKIILEGKNKIDDVIIKSNTKVVNIEDKILEGKSTANLSKGSVNVVSIFDDGNDDDDLFGLLSKNVVKSQKDVKDNTDQFKGGVFKILSDVKIVKKLEETSDKLPTKKPEKKNDLKSETTKNIILEQESLNKNKIQKKTDGKLTTSVEVEKKIDNLSKDNSETTTKKTSVVHRFVDTSIKFKKSKKDDIFGFSDDDDDLFGASPNVTKRTSDIYRDKSGEVKVKTDNSTLISKNYTKASKNSTTVDQKIKNIKPLSIFSDDSDEDLFGSSRKSIQFSTSTKKNEKKQTANISESDDEDSLFQAPSTTPTTSKKSLKSTKQFGKGENQEFDPLQHRM